MKVIDAYKQYKEKYREYVVLIRTGIFYEVYNSD
jgi:DNA mismatch repair ATPase MutS